MEKQVHDARFCDRLFFRSRHAPIRNIDLVGVFVYMDVKNRDTSKVYILQNDSIHLQGTLLVGLCVSVHIDAENARVYDVITCPLTCSSIHPFSITTTTTTAAAQCSWNLWWVRSAFNLHLGICVQQRSGTNRSMH